MKGRVFVRTCLVTAMALLVGANETARAQGIVTDRPDFTESAVTVPLTVLQFEGGATFTRVTEHVDETVLGEGLLRWGVHRRFEVRVGLPSYVSVANGATHSGLGDGSLGAKYQIGPLSNGWDVAAIGTLSMPIGEDEFSSGKVDPSLIVAAGRAMNEKVGLGGQIMVSLPTVGDSRDFEWGATLVMSSSLGSSLGVFGELALTVPEEGSAPLVVHTGLVYGVSQTFQVDVHAGAGLTDTAPDFFLGAGLAAQL